MMKKVVSELFVLLFLLMSLSSCKKNDKRDVYYDKSFKNEIKDARNEIIFYLVRNSVPGATFAVAKDGKLIYSDGLGLASKDLEVPVNRNTKFRIGSLSENFTSLLYQLLVEDGIIHPDSSIQHYFPEFPEKQFKITMKDLVQHTSGIREPSREETDWRGLNISLERGLEQFMNDSLVVPPGTYQLPTLFNYNLLGAILEKVTESPFHDLLATYITDTLGLNNTVVDNPFITIHGRTNYFDHNFIAQVVPATFRDMRHKAPSEGLLSNAEDLVQFGNALLFSDYFSEEVRNRLFEPVTLGNNMEGRSTNGWIILADSKNRRVYGKSSSVTGGSASLIIYPEEKLVVAFASNLSTISDDVPVFEIAQHFLPDAETDKKE